MRVEIFMPSDAYTYKSLKRLNLLDYNGALTVDMEQAPRVGEMLQISSFSFNCNSKYDQTVKLHEFFNRRPKALYLKIQEVVYTVWRHGSQSVSLKVEIIKSRKYNLDWMNVD